MSHEPPAGAAEAAAEGEPEDGDGGRRFVPNRRLGRRALAAIARLEGHPKVLRGARRARERLPGDSRFGDPLSTAGAEAPHVVGRRLAELTAERPGALREAGLGALQVWQSLSEAQGRGRGDREVAIVFTDLADYSTWALEAGDELALDLLRAIGEAVEPPVERRGGRVVKRLGDGLMAVFDDPQHALDATLEAGSHVGAIDLAGYRPRLRAGIHVGRPRMLGGDYLGVDVNAAARLAENASAGEVLVSDTLLGAVEREHLKTRRRRRFKVKGAPRDMQAHAVERAR